LSLFLFLEKLVIGGKVRHHAEMGR